MTAMIMTTFFKVTNSTNEYGEPVPSKEPFVTLGTKVKTERFKDQLQGQISLDGDRQYVWVRRTTKTSKLEIGDTLIFGNSDKEYKIIGIDNQIMKRNELIFLVDALTGSRGTQD